MTTTLPLVRAVALAPFVVLLRDMGRPVDRLLADVGITMAAMAQEDEPIPLRAAITFVRTACRAEGADIPLRAAASWGVERLGFIGLLIRSSRTPREAFHKITRAYPQHGSHGVLSIVNHAGGATVRHTFRVPIDAEDLANTQQYVAALIVAAAAGAGPLEAAAERIELMPHPVAGLAPLAAQFGDRVAPTSSATTAVILSDAVLDRPYPGERITLPQQPEGSGLIRGDGTLASSIRAVLPMLLMLGREPSVASLADLCYMSTRTLQRRLAQEGTSLSQLIEAERARAAVDGLTSSSTPIQDLAARMGYSSSSSFTRAVRRWTSSPPSRLRRDAQED